MTDYSKLSDFEINCEVAKALGASITQPSIANKRSVYYEIKGEIKTQDFCNSWADAGPIIVANKITVCAPMEYNNPQVWMAYPAMDSDICPTDKNPLRAAMCAYLMMRDKS